MERPRRGQPQERNILPSLVFGEEDKASFPWQMGRPSTLSRKKIDRMERAAILVKRRRRGF